MATNAVVEKSVSGTDVQRTDLVLAASDAGLNFCIQGDGKIWRWDGTAWNQTHDAGVPHSKDVTNYPWGDIVNSVLRTEEQNESFSVARTTTDATVGATGVAGDRLVRVILTVAVTTATLQVKDKNGTILASFLTTDPVGTVKEVDTVAAGAGFAVVLHATGAGTVTCIGRFT